MREGLRSRTRLGKISGSEGVVHKERFDVKNEALDSVGEGLGAKNLNIEKKGEVERAVKEGCDLDLDVSSGGNVDLDENDNNRSGGGIVEADLDRKVNEVSIGDGNVDIDENGNNRSGGSIVEADLDRKVNEVSIGDGNIDLDENGINRSGGSIVEADLDRKVNEVSIGGRVLRPRSRKGDDKKSYNEENDGVYSGNNRGSGEFERIKVEECEEADEFLTDGHENERVKVKKEGNVKINLKRKRGRPPKTEMKDQDQPPKTEMKYQDQSPRKRGRPPKAGHQNHHLTMVHNRKGKVGIRKGKEDLTIRDGANVNAIDDERCGRSSGKALKKKGFSLTKKNKLGKVLKTEDNGAASPLRSSTVNAVVSEKSGKNKVKQLVRDQIMERLSAAGWTVDYRPRNGRQYKDAVYVSLDGKTHWSITLAYNRLKRHYEAGDGEGKVYRPGFKFTPIPEEDFHILTKVIVKKRESKGKGVPAGGKGGKTVDGINKKEKKEKPSSAAGMRKAVKGKMKRKWSLLEEGNANVTSPNKMPAVVRDHKRHKTQNKKRCALLVRNAKEEVDSEIDGYVPYSGKRTVLAWMIDLGTFFQNQKVHYMQHEWKLDGEITRDGIHCACCNEIVTISDFGAHASSTHSDPLKYIYREEGTSLLQCLLDSWNKQDEFERKGFHFVDVAGDDPNDDTCGVCGDGGDLICCDGCPSTFHQSCLDIKKFPSGDWHCIYCCCKFCGLVDRSSNQRDVYDDFTVSTLHTCHLCEEKYHRSCIEANGAKTNDSRDAFCGNKCQELSEKLELLLGVKHEIEDGFSCTFVRRSDVGFDASQIKTQMVESNAKLALALSIMDECFMPYIDQRSGINLIHSILYNCGSNFKRLNYSGFVTAVLERGDEIISAACIRIHGNQLAEMPFIGTRNMYRRQGMCRRLLNGIEWALSSLNVELLVIPAISELRETWTNVFGFEPLELTSKQIIKNMNLLVFPHVDMLQKKISKHKFADKDFIPTEVSNLKKNHTLHKVENWDGTGSVNTSPKVVTCQVECQAVHEDLAVDDKSTANACKNVIDSCCQAEDTNTSKNTSYDCVSLNHVEKPIDLNSQSNNCCVPYEERQCLSISRTDTEATDRHDVDALLEVTENFPIEVKVACEVVSNNNTTENSAPCGTESIPIESQIVFTTRESQNSADNIHHDSHKVSDSCELRSKTDCVQLYFIGSKEVDTEPVNGSSSHSRPNGDGASGEAISTTNSLMDVTSQNITKGLPVNCEKNSSVVSVPNAADEAELCTAKTSILQTDITRGDCQSIQISSDICGKIAHGVNERDKASSQAVADFLPADTDVVPKTKPWMEGSSELAEPDLQVDQTARSNGTSLRGLNTASGATLHWASAGSTSCGSTEGIVLSNQAS